MSWGEPRSTPQPDTDPATPAQTEQELRDVRRALHDKARDLRPLLIAAAKADGFYKLGHATALLEADGSSAADREAAALLTTVTVEIDGETVTGRVSDLYADWQNKKAIASAARAAIKALTDQLDAIRSENANARNAAGLGR